MAKITLGANIGIASVSTDVEVKNPIKKIKAHFEKKEENKIQDLKIGFWLSATGACVEKAVVRCSKTEVKNRVKIENVKDPLKLLVYRVSISDFFNENEFVERPQDLSGFENYAEDDFDFNYFIED